MSENLYVNAMKAMANHVRSAVGVKDPETFKKELLKKSKDELAGMIIALSSNKTVTVESVAKLILEDPACDFLTYEEIAEGISSTMGSATTHKCIASYASKNPKTKGWVVVPRRSSKDRGTEMSKLAIAAQ